jgi:hypothetical protein|tara:strand:+ start:14369 stop:15682 length:1314 start_codon:yes stop_codon:yes gene_type:complete
VRNKLAIVFCVHHKPWLMMSTLITTALQDFDDADLFFVHSIGDGEADHPGYAEYRALITNGRGNPQLSPYDERVREVCCLKRKRVFHLEYQNDHALDSGVWYKFIRSRRWREYDYVLFGGEGVLFARQTLLSSMVSFAERCGVHFIASGHEKRRVPKDIFMRYHTRVEAPTELDRLHDLKIREAFAIFCRDREFRALFDSWRSDFEPETQNHIPDLLSRTELAWRVRARLQKRWGSPYLGSQSEAGMRTRIGQRIPGMMDALRSALRMRLHGWLGDAREPRVPRIFVQGRRQPVSTITATEREGGVRYHRVDSPEWFGCAVTHLMSRTFLERLSERLDRYEIYDILDLPFSGTPLEVIWGFTPAWLGFEKWFTDGFHRVRKHFTTYRREDYPPEMAAYINRYYCGRIRVGWQGDHLKIRALRPDCRHLEELLPAGYF